MAAATVRIGGGLRVEARPGSRPGSTTAPEPTLRMSGSIRCLACAAMIDHAAEIGAGDLLAAAQVQHRAVEAER